MSSPGAAPPPFLSTSDLFWWAEDEGRRCGPRLDLGSGSKPKPGFWGIDRAAAPGVTPFDLASGLPWPFADESIEELYSSHFIEHVPACDVAAYEFVRPSHRPGEPELRSPVPTRWSRYVGQRDALCWVMDEAFRVCKPGARFRLRWPALVDERTGVIGRIAFLDPTHRRFIPIEQLAYYQRAGREQLGVTQYPVACDWHLVSKEQADLGIGCEYDVTLEKRAAVERP